MSPQAGKIVNNQGNRFETGGKCKNIYRGNQLIFVLNLTRVGSTPNTGDC
jgi:hypothetical protein